MRWLWSVVPAVVLLNGVLAQESLTDRLPSCATKCFEATLPTTSCTSDDIGCLCTDPKFFTTAAGCNALNCTVVETLSATNETRAACGIPIRSQQTTMIAVTAAFGALAVVMVSLRLVDRGISTAAKLGWDDLLIGLAGVSEGLEGALCR
ncbi:hypothetical protein BDV96DRAFT_189420 [Lophiotrema nucula]|uniref:CFEM domain-containing protein n=1 Tax=Lophiotrema nucula TaxID=690887 RepID=A0A6A5YVY7_9PLEO|nr:hypothetical protein BDV96DRAFT_189420 [Lophiotrema nucula]